MSRECHSQQTHPGTTPPLLPAYKSNQLIRWSHFQELPYIKVREFDVATAVCFRAPAEHTEDEGLPGKLYVTSSVDNLPAKAIHTSTDPELKIIFRKALGYRSRTWNSLVSDTGFSILVKNFWIPK
jgi:2-hydroxychromene-2-carboxylate isomerase